MEMGRAKDQAKGLVYKGKRESKINLMSLAVKKLFDLYARIMLSIRGHKRIRMNRFLNIGEA
jgi:hypothetical protein